MPSYINKLSCISAQNTFATQFPEGTKVKSDSILKAVHPEYKKLIPPVMARRMSPGAKMSLATAIATVSKDKIIEVPDAIIVGTGVGLVHNSEKFLRDLLNSEQGHLSPTAFIQSTHNTFAAQIALFLGCKSYNFTYSSGTTSFESALIDGLLMLEENKTLNILIGGVDELGTGILRNLKPDRSDGKTQNDKAGEGAVFFTLSEKQNKNAYAILEDTEIINTVEENNINKTINAFLERNNLKIDQIDAIISGNLPNNQNLPCYTVVENIFFNTPQFYYKHLCGEFDTAAAFGFWLAANLLKHQTAPDTIRRNSLKKKFYKNVLLYHQNRYKNQSLVLLKAC